MKKGILKNKWLIFALSIIIILIIVLAVFIFGNKGANNTKKELRETTYTAYVRINPLVKLVYKESYYECVKDKKKSVCGEVKEEITEYELLNDDAKKIYETVNLKGKTLEETVVVLINEAKSNDIKTDVVNIISDDQDFDKDEFNKKVNDKLEEDVSFNVTIEKDVTDAFVYEKFDIKFYTVEFDSDGGSSIESQSVTSNGVATLPSEPTKKGYEFVEWQLNNKKYDFSKKVTKDIVLKAKWKKAENKTNNKDDDGNSSTVNKPEEKLTCVPGDKKMPKPDNLKFSPSKITVGKSITATVHITDESGVENAWIRFDNTTGTAASTKLSLKSGTRQDGIFTGTVKIPKGQPAGTWTAVLVVSDPCKSFGDDFLKQEIIAEGSIKDNVRPTVEITSISPNPAKVGDKITVKIKASDASGIKDVNAQLSKNDYHNNKNATLTSGDKYDGVYTATFDIPSGQVDGDWFFSVVVRDIYENVEGNHTMVKVSGGISDNKPPVLQLSSISSTNLNRGDTITLKVKGTDQTEIKELYCGISRAGGSNVGGGNLRLESGSNKDGLYSINIPVPMNIEPNTYELYCRTNDSLNNNKFYDNMAFINVN